MNLLLDTHIWIWWINQDKQLTAKHQAIIAEAKNVFVSSVSCWELVKRAYDRSCRDSSYLAVKDLGAQKP